MRHPIEIPAVPGPFLMETTECALLVIDMQRDFLEPGGFGEALGNDVGRLAPVVPKVRALLEHWRRLGLPVVHTREGHRPDLSDLPRNKAERGGAGLRIGDAGPMGRILVRGERGHEIVPELAPLAGELVIDKPGKGAFWGTDLHAHLAALGVRQLVVTGVTTEVCVHTTVREANDRGYDCLVPSDATGSYFPHFHAVALEMISAQGAIFGWTCTTHALLNALAAP